MKNFTNNFKQITLRLSARWLIMALMLLVGTSSAWAAYYVAGSMNEWSSNNTEWKLTDGSVTRWLNAGTYEWKITNGTWDQSWGNNGNNISTSVSCSGPVTFKFSGSGTPTASFNCPNKFNQSAITFYYDATNTPDVIHSDKCYFMLGDDGGASRTTLSRVSGTQYLYKGSVPARNNNLGWYIFYESKDYTENIHKWCYSSHKSTCTYKSAAATNKVYKGKSTTESVLGENNTSVNRYTWENSQSTYTTYKVTINSVAGGTLTVKDYDNATVSNGTSKSILTVLKFSATPESGYELEKIDIKNSSGAVLKTIAAADLATATYTLESAVTIVPTWKKSCPSKPTFTTSSEVTCSGVTVSPTLSPALAQGNYLVWYDAETGGNKIGTDGKTLTSGANNTATTYHAAVSNGSCESTDRTPYTVYVESTDITNLRLYLVDDQGNELPANHVYCQGETVYFKLSYNGGKYTAYSWNQKVQANHQISGSTSLDEENNTGAGSFTLAGVQSSGTITITLTSCNNQPITSNALQVTVAPVPVIESVTASKTSANCYEYVTLTATTSNLTEGTIVKWYEGNNLVGSGDTYRFTKETAGTANIEARVQNTANCDPVVEAAPAIKFTAESGCSAPAMKQGGIIYLVPNNDWKSDNAWFAAAFIKTESNVKYSYWRNLYDDDGDGTFACEIPSGYSKVVLCRMNPAAGNNMVMNTKVNNDNHSNWTYRWNETGEITIPTTAKKYTITGWGTYDVSNLDGTKTFRTVELNAGSLWVTDGAHFKIHAWSENNLNTGNWIRMVDANGDKIYHADVPTEFTHLVFGRFSSDPNTGYAEWEQTADLDITGGTRYVISKNGGYNVGVNAEGYWSWPEKNSSYDLGVSTVSAIIGNDNTSIICNAQIFKTSCAPAIWYGFQYTKDGGDAVNVEVGNTYVTAGTPYTTTLSNLEKGTYNIRARVKYANNDSKYGDYFTVIIADQCDPDYEFTVGSTSAIVQACGGNRTLPAIEILTDKTPAGKTISWAYEWKNADGTTATNLDYATGNATPTFNGFATQSYKVRVIKKEGSDIKCVQTAEYQVAYEDNSPKATIVAREEVAINETLVLQGSINYSESFTWLVKEGNIDVTAQKLSDISVLNPTFNTQETGTYTVTLTAEANENCKAHQKSITIEVLPPTENCSSSDIEVKLVTNTDCFNVNGGEDLYISQDGTTWTYVTKISGGGSYTILSGYLTEKGITLPAKIMFGALTEYNCNNKGNARAYTITDITNDDKGKFITYTLSSTYDNTTSVIANEKTYKNKFTIASTKEETISNTVSAPSVLSPAAVVNGQSTEVELKAYLETTGCSPISDYGFEYIKQDEKPTSGTEATKVSLKATPISIGKTFRTQVSGLTEGVYWFRAYANNEADKSGSTSWISFTIITDGPYPTLDCNNNALQILDNGKVKVTVTNIGNQPVLKGSYGLTIIDQGAVLAYSPQQVPAIDANNGTVEFTTVLPINKNNYNVTATLTYKGRTQSCNTKICVPQVGGTPDTIRYTIDAAAVTDKCMLVFPTVHEAIDHLKSSKNGDDRFVDKVGDGYMLRQPVVMEVVYSTTPYSGNVHLTTTGGYESGEGHLVINITNINNDGNSGNGKYKINESGNIVDGYNPLIIRAANPNAMPALQHVALRKSRSVTLKNLNIISSDEDKDNAIDIDNNNNSWVSNGIGAFKNAKITISNCKIKSKGFTCVHVSAVDKVYFENNEITADLVNTDVQNENTRCWGSSVKFIRSTNIKFIRNNFMGTHATSVWLQGVEKVLFMNNVFWNNNKIEEDIFAMFRIVQQSDPEKPKNIGIYYNTLFLADNSDGRSKHPKFNFLTLNSNDKSSKDDPISHNGNFETSTIEFKYNNCYSYDTQTPGRPDDPFKGREAWTGLCYNNFWSAKSGADFSFNGCNNDYKFNVNVKNIVCTTTATDPNSLVIRSEGLNKGYKPIVDANGNVGTSGIALNSAAELYYDRTRDEARVGVAEGKWTLGAYQQTANVETKAIIWQGGASEEWDDRNNWIDANTKKTLTCVNTLSVNLQVIIPAPHSENYPAPDERGIVNYPILPEFDVRDARFGEELVNAGQGIITPTTQFAKTINMEYGASLRGVEHLGAGNGSHYDETTTGFTAQRDQWILVGTVVRPWTDNSKKSTRNIKSRDYFITGQTPHVYMHYAYMDGTTAKWSEPFTSLEEYLEVTDVMAINIPNQYGAGKLTSQAYYTYVIKDQPEKINDHLEAKDYSFNGRFVNESALPSYTGLSEGTPVLLNNSYPANIDPKVIEAKNLGTVLMYDYKAGSFCIDPQADKEAVIKPQHGFVFIPAGNVDALTITSDMVVNGETTSRSAGVEMPILSLDLYNANSINGERSRVVVKLDELKDEGPAPLDVTKIFTDNSTTPELYIVMYDNQYQRIHISNTETIIPLGIRLKKSMNVSFQKFSAEGFDKVTLVDKVLNTEYDLLNTKEVITEELSAGDIEGRFFLNLKETDSDDDIEDDDVTTEVEEDFAEKCINILVEGENTVKVITNGVELENIYVSDMAGRTVGYKVSGFSAVVELPVAQGVYMINVIGDTASRTEKVILK